MTVGGGGEPVRKGTTAAGARLGRNVIAIGAVSFFTDVATEMMYPLLPAFLSTVLGVNASFIGAIEGAAESTAALLKLWGGWLSDRIRARKALVVAGYGIASIVRPFVAVAASAWQVLAIRMADRVGKGIRSAPRDALIADSVDPSIRGKAFGFHASADNAGAVLGPLVAFVLLHAVGLSLRSVFWLSAVPGLAALAVAIFGIRDVQREDAGRSRGRPQRGPRSREAAGGPHEATSGADQPVSGSPDASPSVRTSTERLGGTFWVFLAAVLLFTLGNSTDAFLLLRAQQLGVPVALAPVLWALLNLMKAALGTQGGALSDRLGRKPLIVAGWLWYAAVYLAFGRASHAWHAWALFAAYGLFYALTEGTEKALVADIVPPQRRGAAFGWYNLAIGLGALPASLIFGAIWDARGAGTAFALGAALALAGAMGMTLVRTRARLG